MRPRSLAQFSEGAFSIELIVRTRYELILASIQQAMWEAYPGRVGMRVTERVFVIRRIGNTKESLS